MKTNVSRMGMKDALALVSLGLVVIGVTTSIAFAESAKKWSCPGGYTGCTGVTIYCGRSQAACCCPTIPSTSPPSYGCSCQSPDCNGSSACVMGQ